jgi:hypothetical protein
LKGVLKIMKGAGPLNFPGFNFFTYCPKLDDKQSEFVEFAIDLQCGTKLESRSEADCILLYQVRATDP